MNNKILRSGIIFIFIVILTQIASGWKEQTHKLQLTWQALNLIEYIHKDKYPEEIWRVYRAFIEQGAWDEDFPCSNPYLASSGVSADIRANNHYRHALSGMALTGSPFIGLGDPDVDALTWAHKNSAFDLSEEFNGGKQWEGFKRWGWSAGDVQYGNMSWENAINRYGYTKSSKALAFYTLGFILHLLQDMGCPEHVHDDPHGASGYNGFEMWVYNHYMKGDVLGPDIKSLKPKKFASLDAFFKNLSKLAYSVNRFHGGRLSVNPPYIDTTTDLARMFTIDYSMLQSEWRLHNKNGKDMIWGDFAWDKDDYESNPLWTKGHDNGEWWPTSMEMYKAAFDPWDDEEGYYYIELSGDLPYVDRERQLFPAAFLPKPLREVESQCTGWREMDAKGQHLYSLIGRKILPHIVEHSAGLIEHYYDIVNPPPYVEEVKVIQESEPKYTAFWDDVPQGNSQKNDQTKSEITKVKERELITTANKELIPGLATVEVRFSEPVKDVQIKWDNYSQNGSSLHESDDKIWQAEFVIKDDDLSQNSITVSLKATDKDKHYADKGGDLDVNPRTPARRKCYGSDSQSYRWEEYETEGFDSNYIIMMKKDLGLTVHVQDGEKKPIQDARVEVKFSRSEKQGLRNIEAQKNILRGEVETARKDRQQLTKTGRIPDPKNVATNAAGDVKIEMTSGWEMEISASADGYKSASPIKRAVVSSSHITLILTADESADKIFYLNYYHTEEKLLRMHGPHSNLFSPQESVGHGFNLFSVDAGQVKAWKEQLKKKGNSKANLPVHDLLGYIHSTRRANLLLNTYVENYTVAIECNGQTRYRHTVNPWDYYLIKHWGGGLHYGMSPGETEAKVTVFNAEGEKMGEFPIKFIIERNPDTDPNEIREEFEKARENLKEARKRQARASTSEEKRDAAVWYANSSSGLLSLSYNYLEGSPEQIMSGFDQFHQAWMNMVQLFLGTGESLPSVGYPQHLYWAFGTPRAFAASEQALNLMEQNANRLSESYRRSLGGWHERAAHLAIASSDNIQAAQRHLEQMLEWMKAVGKEVDEEEIRKKWPKIGKGNKKTSSKPG